MRFAFLSAALFASVPISASAEPRAPVDVRDAHVVLSPLSPRVGLFDVEALRPPELDRELVLLADVPRFELSLPPLALSGASLAKRDAPSFHLSPELAVESASLTLRLLPTHRAPNPDVPLVLLPRVEGVGSSWFGLDFAAWF